MKKIVHFTAVLLAAALLVTGAAMGDTIDQTDGANQLGGPSLGKVHVLSVPLKAPIVSSNTYVLAELPVGAYVLGVGAHGSTDLSTNATITVYKGTSTSTCATSVDTNLAVAATGVAAYASHPSPVTDSTEFYGVKSSADLTAGTVFLDILVYEP
jgi:hypothetical protein